MAHYRCNACAVITPLHDVALSIRCKLIGEEQIPALVLGKLGI